MSGGVVGRIPKVTEFIPLPQNRPYIPEEPFSGNVDLEALIFHPYQSAKVGLDLMEQEMKDILEYINTDIGITVIGILGLGITFSILLNFFSWLFWKLKR
jgi:hypothetical protein